ncbi:MAG: hypothetical protein JRN53_05380, partial [Nitrososphaerota archaeon]|nr:hypothetical protein [Nitrososphaerota archaeon]
MTITKQALSGKHTEIAEITEITEDWTAERLDQWSLYAKKTYPREVRGTGDWLKAKSESEYLEFLSGQFDSGQPAHTSIYPASTPGSWTSFWIDTMLLELDGPLLDSYSGMRGIVEHLEREYSAKPRVYFSGNRSFHIYVDFIPLFISDPMERLQTLANRIAAKTKVPFNAY